MIDFLEYSGTYLLLETLSLDNSSTRSIYLLEPYKQSLSNGAKVFKLGRGNDQDVRINDISVSRCHARIKFVDNKFILEDNFSKFGTLVLIRDKLDLKPDQIRVIQIGRTACIFSLEPIKEKKANNSAILW